MKVTTEVLASHFDALHTLIDYVKIKAHDGDTEAWRALHRWDEARSLVVTGADND